MPCKNLVGTTFGRLTVKERAQNTARQQAQWLCKCECGGEITVVTVELNRGSTRSCGCLFRDMLLSRNTKHGRHKSAEYNTWCAMKARCNNPNNQDYGRYGGREHNPIKVCDRWLNSFEAFYTDMGDKPSPDHTLDRRNNDGPYAPHNCRWATAVQQANNSRKRRS